MKIKYYIDIKNGNVFQHNLERQIKCPYCKIKMNSNTTEVDCIAQDKNFDDYCVELDIKVCPKCDLILVKKRHD